MRFLKKDEVTGLVDKADTDGDGSVDFRDIDQVIVSRIRAPSTRTRLAATGPNAHERGADKRTDDVRSASPSGDDERPRKRDE